MFIFLPSLYHYLLPANQVSAFVFFSYTGTLFITFNLTQTDLFIN